MDNVEAPDETGKNATCAVVCHNLRAHFFQMDRAYPGRLIVKRKKKTSMTVFPSQYIGKSGYCPHRCTNNILESSDLRSWLANKPMHHSLG